MQIECLDSPYGELIKKYLQTQMPRITTIHNDDVVDIVSSILVGTKELRYGPLPSPEIQVNIRAVVRDAVSKAEPIPVVIPWGGRKSIPNQTLDSAELAGLWQLINVDKEIRKYYSPGLVVNIAIEDTGALWLYRGEPNLSYDVKEYTDSMVRITNLIKGTTNITPLPESTLMDTDTYIQRSEELAKLLYTTLVHAERFPDFPLGMLESYQELVHRGWKGDLSMQQRQYYIERYKALYGSNEVEALQKLADYLAGAKVRYDLNGKGVPKTNVDGYIKVSFTPPIPGMPKGLNDTTVYWRTLPSSVSRNHIPPWRARGYMEIDGSNVCIKLASWSNLPVLESATAVFNSQLYKLPLNVDYLVTS